LEEQVFVPEECSKPEFSSRVTICQQVGPFQTALSNFWWHLGTDTNTELNTQSNYAVIWPTGIDPSP
jgi:hypothetical protein